MGVLLLIGLGSNVGDRRSMLDAALVALASASGLRLVAASPYLETPPIGGPPGQGAFLNGAALAEADLPPGDVLALLHDIESRSGRARAARWGERTLDLDLLLYGDLILDGPSLAVPHPRMAVRRFVLGPAATIAPGLVDPVTGLTVSNLLANLDRRPGLVAFLGPGGDALAALLAETDPSVVPLGPDHAEAIPDDPSDDRWFVAPRWRDNAGALRPILLAATDPQTYAASRGRHHHAAASGIPVVPLHPAGLRPNSTSSTTGDGVDAMLSEVLAALEASRAGVDTSRGSIVSDAGRHL